MMPMGLLTQQERRSKWLSRGARGRQHRTHICPHSLHVFPVQRNNKHRLIVHRTQSNRDAAQSTLLKIVFTESTNCIVKVYTVTTETWTFWGRGDMSLPITYSKWLYICMISMFFFLISLYSCICHTYSVVSKCLKPCWKYRNQNLNLKINGYCRIFTKIMLIMWFIIIKIYN